MNSIENDRSQTNDLKCASNASPASRSFRAWGVAAMVGLMSMLVGCSATQPSLPTVDDTQRRPVNSAAALELLSCRAEAQALRLNLLDPPNAGVRAAAACSGVTAPAPAASPQTGTETRPQANPTAGSRSSRAVFEFEVGATELVLDEATRKLLLRTAQSADLVLVHASRAASPNDKDSDAKTRAQATAQALVKAGIEAQKLRVSWNVGEEAPPLNASAVKSANRVEVEFVERSGRLLFSQPAVWGKPAVAALDPAGKSN